jgi:hypothetical protein
MVTADGTTVEDVLNKLQKSIGELPPRLAHRAGYATAFRRAISDVGVMIDYDRFIDPAWAERLVIRATDRLVRLLNAASNDRSDEVSAPWRLVFAALTGLSPRRRLILGMGAQLNFDLPQAVLDATSAGDFDHPDVLTVHRWDHERIDAIMAPRIADQFAQSDSRFLNRLLGPVFRLGVRLMLRDARLVVWQNVLQLRAARLLGEGAYRRRLAELEALTAARIQALQASWLVVVRYLVTGFGVLLQPIGGQQAAGRPAAHAHLALLPQQRRPGTLDRRNAPTNG